MTGSLRYRYLLLAVVALGVGGVGLELLLLGHYDGYWQITPLVLLGLGIAVIGWHAVDRGRRSLLALQGLMAGYLAAGVAGLILHFNGNAEFEREMVPEIRGLALVAESLTGATPVLAPGVLIQLGLLGLLYTFRHPALTPVGVTYNQPSE
ncbi:MAG: hypothetical protein FJ206_17000 [Gemmatimonadetes bacterium]|nr:hypothetical protein [Gemmatimonadota bacterium]